MKKGQIALFAGIAVISAAAAATLYLLSTDYSKLELEDFDKDEDWF